MDGYEDGRRLWAFNTTAWKMTEEEYEEGLSLVLPEEKTRIKKFIFERDRKSALAGRLLIRRLLNEVLDLPYCSLPLIRTKERKPALDFYKIEEKIRKKFPFFNFNLSHHGDWVILVSDPLYLVGVDVMKTEISGRNKEVQPFFHTMRSCFTKYEWLQIYKAHEHQTQEWSKERVEKEQKMGDNGFKSIPSFENINLEYFMKFWTLKESYIKAVGVGLGLELQDFFFHQIFAGENTFKGEEFFSSLQKTDAEVCVKGKWLDNWTFKQTTIDRDHPVAIAYGPPNEALPTFLQTFTTPPPDIQPQQPQQQQEQQHKNFKFRPLPPTKHVFRVLEIQDLLPLKS